MGIKLNYMYMSWDYREIVGLQKATRAEQSYQLRVSLCVCLHVQETWPRLGKKKEFWPVASVRP